MRASILFSVAAASLAIGAACADSKAEPPPSESPPGPAGRDADVPEVGTPDASVPDTSLPECSAAGWCVTPIPDDDLDFTDIWPFEDRAFAVAKSHVERIKILEWQRATGAWQYIDDKTQNDVGAGTFSGRIYAPNEDEVYFTVGPAFVYHGKRPAPPQTQWTWTRHELPDNVVGHPPSHNHGNPESARTTYITLGVWGTGAEDVYAYYSNTIFRRNPADGSWSSAFVIDDSSNIEEHVFFTGAAAAGRDDLWFIGARDFLGMSCPLIVRKTPEGWTRAADAIAQRLTFPYACEARPGTTRLGGVGGGWLVDIVPSSATEYLAIQSATKTNGTLDSVQLTRLRSEDGGLAFDQSTVPVQLAQSARMKVMSSMWRAGGENWFTSWGLVLRGTDEGTYAVSTISRDGAPVDAPLHRVRGTSKQNLWAVGARHAYHKTTP